MDPEAVNKLRTHLSTEAARTTFAAAVDRHEPDVVSVDELRMSFPAGVDLAQRVGQLVGANDSEAERPSVLGPRRGLTHQFSCKAVVTSNCTASLLARCKLPQIDPLYCGREAEVQQLYNVLTTPNTLIRVITLVSGGGMGKSSLALDLGWRLARAGRVPAGALWVDLRDARTPQSVEARFCDPLGVTPVRAQPSAKPLRQKWDRVAGWGPARLPPSHSLPVSTVPHSRHRLVPA